jgi:hypothetical protein
MNHKKRKAKKFLNLMCWMFSLGETVNASFVALKFPVEPPKNKYLSILIKKTGYGYRSCSDSLKKPGREYISYKYGSGTQLSRITIFLVRYRYLFLKSVRYAKSGAFLMSWGWCWASRSFSPRLCCPEKSSSSGDPNYRKNVLIINIPTRS